jgi:signal transduction histidine kinase
MEMQALAARLPGAENRRALEHIVADAGASLREARRSLTGLRTRPEGRSGLAEAIAQTSRQLTEAKGIRLKLQLDPRDFSLPADVEDNLLRIAQEAVFNAVKHSDTRSLLVALDRTPAHRVQLLVKDDGAGFGGIASPQPGHFGIVGMQERAAHIGATLSLETAPGSGTAVMVTIDVITGRRDSRCSVETIIRSSARASLHSGQRTGYRPRRRGGQRSGRSQDVPGAATRRRADGSADAS